MLYKSDFPHNNHCASNRKNGSNKRSVLRFFLDRQSSKSGENRVNRHASRSAFDALLATHDTVERRLLHL
jgi:hypothetical protein